MRSLSVLVVLVGVVVGDGTWWDVVGRSGRGGVVVGDGTCPALDNSVDFWATDINRCIDLSDACGNCQCSDPNYEMWLSKNCAKTCNFCDAELATEASNSTFESSIILKKRASWSMIEGKKAKGPSILNNVELTAAKEKCEELGAECEGLSCKGDTKCDVMADVSKTRSNEEYSVYVKEEEDPVNGCNSYKCVQDGSGTLLAEGERITSQNGEVFLVMQGNGNLVLYCSAALGGTPLWHSATYGKTVNDGLLVQGDKNLVIYGTQRSCSGYTKTVVLWSSGVFNVDSSTEQTSLVAEDDRNVVLYNADGEQLWSTETAGNSC